MKNFLVYIFRNYYWANVWVFKSYLGNINDQCFNFLCSKSFLQVHWKPLSAIDFLPQHRLMNLYQEKITFYWVEWEAGWVHINRWPLKFLHRPHHLSSLDQTVWKMIDVLLVTPHSHFMLLCVTDTTHFVVLIHLVQHTKDMYSKSIKICKHLFLA